ncbi:unnamed protein product [Rangifer tarandus platyrhynchus]|uniref:Uncharacterized protein n=2 Tax=Rangifer tarandus platyrhynchus TaxID=3082113 RepID=A0ABN8ZTY7_RANTA|nr:unnamed protein product [Rangifer tarandus platyrhynchus]
MVATLPSAAWKACHLRDSSGAASSLSPPLAPTPHAAASETFSAFSLRMTGGKIENNGGAPISWSGRLTVTFLHSSDPDLCSAFCDRQEQALECRQSCANQNSLPFGFPQKAFSLLQKASAFLKPQLVGKSSEPQKCTGRRRVSSHEQSIGNLQESICISIETTIY